MAAKQDYASVIEGIHKRGGFTRLRKDAFSGYNLVCASHRIGTKGNSFWMWCSSTMPRAWFLSTWAPRCYGLPSSADVVEVSMMCLSLAVDPITALPDSIVSEFDLTEVVWEKFEMLQKRDCE
jgi:hypothetical protein